MCRPVGLTIHGWEYRVEIHRDRALPELRIQVEPSLDHVDPPGLALKLEAALHHAFALRIPVTSVPHGNLPRFEMKAHRWVRV